MLTFQKVLEVFGDYLKQDPLYEVITTSHGYTLMAWEPKRDDWYKARYMATPKILMNSLLDTYANFMEDQVTDNERDLTEQETAEIKRQCDLLRVKCMGQ